MRAQNTTQPSLQAITRRHQRRQADKYEFSSRLDELDRTMEEVLSLDGHLRDRNPYIGQVEYSARESIKTPYFGYECVTQAELEKDTKGQRLCHYSIEAPINTNLRGGDPEPEQDFVVGTRNIFELDHQTGLITHSRASFEHPLQREFEKVWDPFLKYEREFEGDPWVHSKSGRKIHEEKVILDPKRGTITYLD